MLKEHEEMLREAWRRQYEKKKMAAEKVIVSDFFCYEIRIFVDF